MLVNDEIGKVDWEVDTPGLTQDARCIRSPAALVYYEPFAVFPKSNCAANNDLNVGSVLTIPLSVSFSNI